MKKQIAALLTFAMVLTLASCSKDDKKTKSPRFSLANLEITETTPETSESSETTIETTIESTSETSETAVTTIDPTVGSFTIDHSLEKLDMENTPFSTCYGYCKQLEDFELMFFVQEYGDLYFAKSEEFPELDLSVFEIYDSIFTPQDEAYEREFNRFIEDLHSTGDADPSICTSEIEVYRADSQIYSFVIDEYITGKDYNPENHYGYYAYNLRSSDGSLIELSDVIIDTEAFCTFLSVYLAYTPQNPVFGKTEDINIDELTEEIRSGKALFALSYDSIYFFQGSRFFKVPVYPLTFSECIDMTYFGSTPEYYALKFDYTGALDWDIDNDGIMDSLCLSYVPSSDEGYEGTFEKILLYLNGTELTITPNDLDPYVFDASAYLIQADDGLYLLISNIGMDSYTTDYIYRIENNQVTYVTEVNASIDKIIYDPEYIECRDYYDLIGSTSLHYYFTMLGTQGKPALIDNFFYSYGYLAATSKDLQADKVDAETGESIGLATIPANTPIETVFYDSDADVIYFQTLHENSSENEFFVIPNDHDMIVKNFKGMVFAG